MGIFTDLAIGGLTQFGEVAEKDTATNLAMAQNSLNKENKAFQTTELAYKNFDEIKNIVSNNLELFNIKPMGNFSEDQIVDMYVGKAFKEQRSIFENNDFNKVKMNFANYVARTPGEDFSIDISSPYVASADKFEREKDKHAEKLTAISKTPRVDKLLLNLRKIDEQNQMPVADQMGDAQLKIASITARGYGVLNTFPGTIEGNANLNFMKVNIITANAKAKFPNDEKARGQFIDQKLYENNINPSDAINYKSPLTYKLMSDVISQSGGQIAIRIADNMNAIARSTDNTEIAELQNQNSKLLLSQHKLMDAFSGQSGVTLAGQDRSTVFPIDEAKDGTVQIRSDKIPEGYVPDIDTRGNVILPFGEKSPLSVLVKDENSLKRLPPQVQTFVNSIKTKFFDDRGEMREPTREDFIEGKIGNRQFTRFLNLFYDLYPNMDPANDPLGGYGFIQSPPDVEKKKEPKFTTGAFKSKEDKKDKK